MSLVVKYSAATEFLMEQAETTYLPDLAAKLAAAQARARGENTLGEDLDPANDIVDLEEWMEQVKGLSRAEIASLTSSGWTTNANEHAAWRKARHDELAQTVADLGALYADYADTVFAEPPPPEPDGMPGASTFQRPTGGVFADNPTDTQTPDNTTRPEPGVNTEAIAPVPDDDEDEDDEASPWTYPSYDDFDEPSGGLASGGTTTALPTGGSPLGGTTTTISGGGTAPGSGFPGTGPAGAGIAPGRGANAANPMRGTAPSNARSGAAPRSNMNPNIPARPGAAGRGSVNAPANGRRNTDENEEEETTARASKYVEAEDIFSAPFDPAAGPAHEGPKHQRAWDKEHAAWEERRREEEA